MGKIKLGILAGGSSAEREVSFKSCENLMNSLDKNKYDIHIYSLPGDNDREWIKELMENTPDIVVSALHGGHGENGSVQGLLQCMGIPYVGSKVCQVPFVWIKSRLKQYLRQIIYRRRQMFLLREAKVWICLQMKYVSLAFLLL